MANGVYIEDWKSKSQYLKMNHVRLAFSNHYLFTEFLATDTTPAPPFLALEASGRCCKALQSQVLIVAVYP